MKIPKRWRLLTLSVIFIFPCGFFNHGPPRLTQAEAEKRAGIFCLPAYLPTKVDPNPEFYGVGEEFHLPIALYKNIETSERILVIFMENISDASPILRGDSKYYDPYYRHCPVCVWNKQ